MNTYEEIILDAGSGLLGLLGRARGYEPDVDKISNTLSSAMFRDSLKMPQRIADIRAIVERCIEVRNQIESATK
jgi:hypothetical protein